MEYSRTATPPMVASEKATKHGAHCQALWELTRAALAFAIKKIVNEVDATGARATNSQDMPTGILSKGDAT